MKLKNRYPERACGIEDSRLCLNECYLNVEKSRIESTNGHIAALLPVELDEGDTSGWISDEAIKAARKIKGPLNERVLDIRAGGTLETANGEFERHDFGKMVDMERIIPKKAPEDCVRVAFNAELLHQLADAICDQNSSQIILNIDPDDKNRGMLVTPLDSEVESIGIIMPCRLPR